MLSDDEGADWARGNVWSRLEVVDASASLSSTEVCMGVEDVAEGRGGRRTAPGLEEDTRISSALTESAATGLLLRIDEGVVEATVVVVVVVSDGDVISDDIFLVDGESLLRDFLDTFDVVTTFRCE